ncbi:MAG: hypothetical protein IPL49_20765 [Saprospirales bacterium]|nr:hypothetical protein [Saprospirales bacterium]
METPVSSMESLLGSAEVYGKTTFELAKLKALETTTLVATSLVSRLSVILAVSLFALVFNIGIALLLGDVFGKSYYGFFIVAAFYLLVAAVLYFFLPAWIKKTVSGLIIKEALD